MYFQDLACLIERYLEPLKEETYLSGEDIQQLFGLIMCAGDDLIFSNNDGPNRDLTLIHSDLRLFERLFHEMGITVNTEHSGKFQIGFTDRTKVKINRKFFAFAYYILTNLYLCAWNQEKSIKLNFGAKL